MSIIIQNSLSQQFQRYATSSNRRLSVFQWDFTCISSPKTATYFNNPESRQTCFGGIKNRRSMLNACFCGPNIEMTKKKAKETMDIYHKWCRGDIREQVDRNPPPDEHGCRQAGEALAATAAGGVGPGVIANHYPSLLKAPKTVLQVATEALSEETNGWSKRK